MSIFKIEPALITGVITAVIALLVAFNVPITDAQSAAIVGTVVAVLALGQAFATRALVTPTAKVVVKEEDGVYVSGPADDTAPNGAPVIVTPEL